MWRQDLYLFFMFKYLFLVYMCVFYMCADCHRYQKKASDLVLVLGPMEVLLTSKPCMSPAPEPGFLYFNSLSLGVGHYGWEGEFARSVKNRVTDTQLVGYVLRRCSLSWDLQIWSLTSTHNTLDLIQERSHTWGACGFYAGKGPLVANPDLPGGASNKPQPLPQSRLHMLAP